MDGHKNRADPERFFLKEDSSLEGSLKKMAYLQQNTSIKVQVPLKSQIYEIIDQSPSGLTVQEISAKLCLNTKTCAKILDEMIYKFTNLTASAHRYGRVYVHKYHILHENKEEKSQKNKEIDNYTSTINENIQNEIKEVENEIGELVKEAISNSLKKEKKHNRQRVTQQSYIRALFVVARIRKMKVCSVVDLKDMICNELEPNPEWTLDKKTVLRIVWKLRNAGIIKELCFRVRIRKDDENEISFLGEHQNFIIEDKQQYKNCTVIYKSLAALPGIFHNDPLVLNCPAIKNPTNRKIIEQNQANIVKPSMNIKSKTLKEIVIVQNNAYKKLKSSCVSDGIISSILLMEQVIKGEEITFKNEQIILKNEKKEESLNHSQAFISKGYSLAIFTKAIFKLLTSLLYERYKLLFNPFKMPLSYTALKNIFNSSHLQQTKEKYSLAYESFSLNKRNTLYEERGNNDIEILTSLALPKKRKRSLEDIELQLKKIFITMERKPGLMNDETLKKYSKGIDTDPHTILKYISDLGFIEHKKKSLWQIKYSLAMWRCLNVINRCRNFNFNEYKLKKWIRIDKGL